VHSNTKERNPSTKAELTLSQLAEKFKAFVDEYHHKKHSETHETPLEFWAKHCQAEGANPRDLDILLLAAETRKLTKPCINYGSRRYWHDDLAEIPVGTEVEIRAQPHYMRPDTIEVFYEKRHLCTAFAHDSVQGRAVTGKRVLAAQRRQMQRIRKTIRDKQATLHNADRTIEAESTLVQQQLLDEQGTVPSRMSQEQLHETAARQINQVPSSPTPSKKRALSGSSPSTKQRNAAWDKALAARKRQQQRQEERSKL
jgi:hypothetical protein